MSGAGGLIGGAALGTAFNVLYDVLDELITKNVIFTPLLKEIKSRLDSLAPLLKDIEKSNKKLDLSDKELVDLKEHLEKGIEVVKKCKKIRWWSLYKRYKYANKLIEWDESLQRLLEILNVQGIRDMKDSSLSVRNIENVLSRIESNLVIPKQPDSDAWCAVPQLPPLVVGLDGPLRELKMKLLKDKNVSMVVLTAPGGCGKTTLATKFCQDKDVKDTFKDNIFFITVSKKPKLENIVQDLYQRKGFPAPTFENEVSAVMLLQRFLKEQGQNPLLIVLDDVWSGSESLVEKFDEFKTENHKFLVTSRSEFRGYGFPYHLQSLDHDNAMKLFHHSASLGDKSSHIPKDLPEKIVERCKGFPLAITVVGRSLCGEPIEIWQKRVIEWSKGFSILDSETELLLCLEKSLGALDKEMVVIKECFLDLGSFPEDQRIPAAALIDIWAELHDVDTDIECIANLYELTKRSLANLVVTRKDKMEGDGYYSEHFVTQHDVLRELAIYNTKKGPVEHRKRLIVDICGDNLPKWWREQKHQPMKARLLSITTDEGFSTKWHNMQMPEVEVLVLNFQTKNYGLPESVVNMDELKAVIVTNYGFLPADLSNFQLLSSLPNLKRIRLERISILSITKNPIQLASLKKISLFMCNIGQAFNNCSISISSAFPNLEEMNIDYCSDLIELPAEVCDLSKLWKLSVTNCHKLSALPEGIGKLENLELLRLRSCTELSKLPTSMKNLGKVNFLDISDCFSIKVLPEDIGEMSSLRKINMRQCSRLQELPPSVVDLEQLEEVVCDEETKYLWESFSSCLNNVRIIVAKENINLNWLHKTHF
ncbi:probable disease resistance protein At5g66900 [Pyrus x bretschneideri]|uniref:probable disease resistance protein At5g66900 n=1 Tax=Pyrus x bretschneideri TaxID=225117 RepID=UPI00202E9CC6|nr:probable disease resistance protein At5g66900 [Pyrus x bretschneideri]XP_048431280.1 probable disease resistance protein At5g66900 [Pyrus x bretschneideri]XP_048431281.1 probable disease resistance protein At5g66900 [Pyrus x bretschneideri]